MIKFRLSAKSDRGTEALMKFQKDCQALLVRRLLTVYIVTDNPYSVDVIPNQFIAGTFKNKNIDTMRSARDIIHKQWMSKYNIEYDKDYVVE